MTVFTKRAVEVFAPTTAGGAQRGADMAEAATWGTEVEGDLGQLATAIGAIETGNINPSVIFLDASGTVDWTTITATSFGAALTEYSDTKLYVLVPHGENGAGPSLNINGLGAKPIIEIDGSPIFSRRFNPYEPLLLQYGTGGGGTFQILSPKEQSYFHFLSADPANTTTIAATSYRSQFIAYQDNGLYLLFATGENGADASINVNGLGLRWVYEMDGTAVAPGRWREGDYLLLQYSSIGFNLITILNDRTGAIAYRTAQEAQQTASMAVARIAEMEFAGVLLKRTTAGSNIFASGTATSVPWEAAEFDVGGWWSVSAPDEIKVPAGSLARGIIVDAQVLLSGSVGDATLEVEKFVSGAWTYNYLGYSQRKVTGASAYCGGKWSTGFIPAAPGDRFRLRLTQTSGSPRQFDVPLNQSSLSVRAVF